MIFRKEVVEAQKGGALGEVMIAAPPSRWLLSGLAVVLAIVLLLFLFLGHYTRRESVTGQLAIGKNSDIARVRGDASRLSSNSGASQLTPAESAKLRSEHFVEISDVEALPSACKDGFARLTAEPSFSLADPGRPYRATDVMASQASLPWRRLIIGAASKDRCVIHYEMGGFATRYAVVVFDLSKADSPRFVWGGMDVGKQPDLQVLISKMTRGAFGAG